MLDPSPPEAEIYPAVPDTYRLDTGHVSLFYRIIGDEIDIVLVWPNS
jgi:hypothetical protein